MADNSRAINRVFTRKVISDLVQDGKSDVFDYVVKRYVENPSEKTHGQLISEIYARLNQQQRNEYFYMNTLLNKLLCGIHNVNTTAAFSQVRIESLSANTKIFRDIANEIAKPLRRNDSTLAYLPTQFITEFIKSNGYAGVAYTSTMGTEGINVAVFDESLFKCVAVHTVEINNISYAYGEIE